MKSLHTLLFLILCMNCVAQKQGQARADSLLNELKNYHMACEIPCDHDTIKVMLLNQLAWELKGNDPDTAIYLSLEGLSLSEKINWTSGIGQSNQQLGGFYYLIGVYDSALMYYNLALDAWSILEKSSAPNDKLQIKYRQSATYGNAGMIFSAQGDYDKAIAYYNIALRMGEELIKSTDLNLVQLGKKRIAIQLGNIGIVYKSQGHYSLALEYYFKAKEIEEELNNRNGVAIQIGSIGAIYNLQGDYAKAIEYYLKALKIMEELKNKSGIAVLYGSLGIAYKNKKDYIKAIDYYQKALVLSQEIKNKTSQANNLNNIGGIHFEQGNFEKSLEYFLSAVPIYESLNDKYALGLLLGNIAVIYDKQGKDSIALEYFHKALKIDDEVANNLGKVIKWGDLGAFFLDRNKYDEAESYLLKAISLANSINALNEKMQFEVYLSQLYSQTGDYKKAYELSKLTSSIKDTLFNEQKTKEITRLEMNYEFDKKQDSTKAEQEKQLAIAEIEKRRAVAEIEKQRLLAEAEKQLQVSEADRKRIIAEAASKRTTEELTRQQMLAEFERMKSEQKLKLSDAETQLQKQKSVRIIIAGSSVFILFASGFAFLFYRRIVRQKQKETSLSLQVSETEMKALRSQMNPHFIFNALQSIQTFLISHKSEEANTYLLKFSKLMRLVLENSQHREISLQKDMQALELYMQLESIRLQHPFTYQFHIDEEVDIEETTIPPLILQPFVENAIWHGLQYKNEPGHINIYISKRNNELHATVEDNGIGRDMSKQNEQPMLMKKESLGMKLTEERLKILNELKKIKAQFKITDMFTTENKPAGTRVELSLPFEV